MNYTLYQATRDHLVRFQVFIFISIFIALILYLKKNKGRKWFLLMNGVWAIINTCIAIGLKYHIHVPSSNTIDFVFDHIVKWMSVNVGLDVVYGLVGFYLLVLSRRVAHNRLMFLNFGNAILLQGAGLFLIDVIFLYRVLFLRSL